MPFFHGVMIISLFDTPPSFGLARMLADRLSRPVGFADGLLFRSFKGDYRLGTRAMVCLPVALNSSPSDFSLVMTVFKSKRMDMHRRSSPVFLEPQQNRLQIGHFRWIISLCLTPSHCLTLFRGPPGI
jgi:hypothetical protein